MPLTLHVPQSKSMTQRAIVMAALGAEPVAVQAPLICDDSERLIDALGHLGPRLERREGELLVEPHPLKSEGTPLFCGNAGTTLRFLSAFALVVDGPLVLDGDARMRQRPMGPLGQALEHMGVEVSYLETEGCPPVRLRRTAPPPSEISVDMSLSSQYASALLLVAPRLGRPLLIRLAGSLVSRPYVAMTVAMMRAAGADCRWLDEHSVMVHPSTYSKPVVIEPDWSAAAFLLAAGFFAGISVSVAGLVPPERSLQGDSAFAAFLQELREPREHHFDLAQAPDLLSPLVVAALGARHPSLIRGVAHARLKESDRIAVLSRELRKLGASIEERPDGVLVSPGSKLWCSRTGTVDLDPADDHRMAMAFGIVSLLHGDLRIANPRCVSKSFPEFWTTLEALRTALLGEKP